MERFWIACALVFVSAACNPKSLKPGYCHTSADCNGRKCDPKTLMCEMDASASDGDGGEAGEVGDAKDAEVMLRCPETISCADGGFDGGAGVCEPDAGMCVECLVDGDCASKSKTPICEAHVCRACKTDADCKSDPNICMTDGHCAGIGEVIYVESVTGGCSASADGSSAKPYCTPNEGVTALRLERNVIVIRGAVGDRMVLGTTGYSPVVIGRKNSANDAASIPATNMTGITVTSDTVLVRDLLVNAGTVSASKGIVVSGSSTKLTLSNVQVNLGTNGLGIQADTGADLTMDRCTVTGNAVGGLLINGASFSIQNSAFIANGYGVKFNATAIPRASQFSFSTIGSNTGNALTCDSTNVQTLTDSIVLGFIDSCVALNSILTMPPQLSGYHLTSHLSCPMTSAVPPDHDIDGQLRTGPIIDCGADQFLQ